MVEDKISLPGQLMMTIDNSRRGRTGASGGVLFAGVYGTHFDLDVSRRGYATKRLRGVALPQAGSALLVVMQHGRTVTVSVVSHTGGHQRADVRAELDGRRIGRVGTGSSRIMEGDGSRITDIVTLVAMCDGLQARVEHDTRKPDARIELPPFGSGPGRAYRRLGGRHLAEVSVGETTEVLLQP